MTIEEKIKKLKMRQDEEIQNIKDKIQDIKNEYIKNNYKTDKFEKKEEELIKLTKEMFWIHLNIIANKPEPEMYENIANEMERLVGEKRDIIYKLNYPMLKIQEYNRKKSA